MQSVCVPGQAEPVRAGRRAHAGRHACVCRQAGTQARKKERQKERKKEGQKERKKERNENQGSATGRKRDVRKKHKDERQLNKEEGAEKGEEEDEDDKADTCDCKAGWLAAESPRSLAHSPLGNLRLHSPVAAIVGHGLPAIAGL